VSTLTVSTETLSETANVSETTVESDATCAPCVDLPQDTITIVRTIDRKRIFFIFVLFLFLINFCFVKYIY
jgi:hypothetical protein